MQGPFECYRMSDIEAGLGLKRKHLIAISLLVGNDHDLNGVQGIGLETALCFVKRFNEDEILNKLHNLGNGDNPLFQCGIKSTDGIPTISDESSPKKKCSHCSFCGHPGSKRAHFKSSCEYCGTTSNESCIKKLEGLDKSSESSQKPHLVFLCLPLPPPSFSSFFLPTKVKVLLLDFWVLNFY
ncbi:hypothetical protein SLEP1_g58829 [Rubroshorea leprosula]|uniref:XPG-I domain-containing protein n=1 Tax=Rubroshorea leprosula TaxID=152421 RepID=A0AAV5MTD0_9ROSI|nr:hypothetical protein SLEP1_g58829 [Rubroshorea leprosula]